MDEPKRLIDYKKSSYYKRAVYFYPIPFRIIPQRCKKCSNLMNMYGKSDYCEVHRMRYDLKDLLIEDRKDLNKRIAKLRRLLSHRIQNKACYYRKKERLANEKIYLNSLW